MLLNVPAQTRILCDALSPEEMQVSEPSAKRQLPLAVQAQSSRLATARDCHLTQIHSSTRLAFLSAETGRRTREAFCGEALKSRANGA